MNIKLHKTSVFASIPFFLGSNALSQSINPVAFHIQEATDPTGSLESSALRLAIQSDAGTDAEKTAEETADKDSSNNEEDASDEEYKDLDHGGASQPLGERWHKLGAVQAEYLYTGQT